MVCQVKVSCPNAVLIRAEFESSLYAELSQGWIRVWVVCVGVLAVANDDDKD